MFGIGKETEKVIKKVEDKRAEDEIQFDFEEDDNLPIDDDEGFADDDAADESAPGGRRQPLPQRTVLLLRALLLLALALAGGGYYYLNGPPAPPSTPPAPVKTIVKVPANAPPAVSPAPVVAVKPAVAPAPVKSPQPAVAAKEQAPVVKAVPVAEKTVPVAAVAAPLTRQPFTLSIGAFLSQKHQREVEKKIHRLGYTPKVQTTYSMVPMIRLRLGVYDRDAVAARRMELVAQVPELFALKQGDKVALYAGSYQSLDQARSFADQLYLRGIHVDEEVVSLRLPLKKISYGSFASRAAAEKAAKSAAAVGLAAQVVKR